MGFFNGLKIFNSNVEALQSESYNIQVIYIEYSYTGRIFRNCKCSILSLPKTRGKSQTLTKADR